MEKLWEECEEAQALVVAVAVPVLAAVHRDLALVVAVAAIAQQVFHLEETLLASLPPVAMLLTFCPPVGGACGCGVCAYGPMPIFVGGGGDDHADHDHEPFGGVRGSWAAHDLHLQVATELLDAGSSKTNSALARGGGAARAGRARAPPGLARAMPSGPQKNWKTYDDIANQSQYKVIRGSLALPDNKRGSGQALLLKGYTQLPECVYAQCYRLKLQIHAAEFLTNVQGNTSSGNPWDLYISRSC